VDPLMRSLSVVEGDVLLQNVLNLTGPHLLLMIQVADYLSAMNIKARDFRTASCLSPSEISSVVCSI